MAKINFNNKNTGDQFTASEVNEIKNVVNTNDTRVDGIETTVSTNSGSWSGGGGGLTNWTEDTNGHIIPNANATYDIGSAEKKVRHFYLSDNSLYFGNDEVPFNSDNILRSVEVSDEFGVAPTDGNSPGVRGELRVVAGYMYLCIVDNTWIRAPIQYDWSL